MTLWAHAPANTVLKMKARDTLTQQEIKSSWHCGLHLPSQHSIRKTRNQKQDDKEYPSPGSPWQRKQPVIIYAKSLTVQTQTNQVRT